jgi:hypothetical protein
MPCRQKRIGQDVITPALYRLNPVIPEHANFDVTDEYPRSDVEEYRQKLERKEVEPAIVVKAQYRLEQNELEASRHSSAKTF